MAFSNQLINILSRVTIFKEMGPAEIEELALMCTRKKLEANSKITFNEGEENSFCIVNDGHIIAKSIGTGESVRMLEPSDFFGEISALDLKNYPVEFYADSQNAEILLFTNKDFLDLLQNHPAVHLALSRELCWRLRTVKNDEVFASVSTKVRLGSALLRLAKGNGVTKTIEGIILPRITQDELSVIADISKEGIKESFLELKNSGLIQATESKQILVKDDSRLEAWTKKYMH